MAIDFLIFGLLLISFVINLLALGAFWVTPSLRTTANRFTINLLIINLIGCLILAPTLFLSGTTTFENSDLAATFVGSASDDSIEFHSKPGNHQMIIRHNGKLVEQEGIIVRKNVTKVGEADEEPRTVETIYKCNSTFCQEVTIDERGDSIFITEFEEENNSATVTTSPVGYENTLASRITMRSWAIDLAAALGALAVLLIVGDTWMAVTDPLRYHSRISGVKAWVFIALTWALGLLFGALSAFRELDFESDMLVSNQNHFVDAANSETYYNLTSSQSIFDMIFGCLYFIVIILLPFGFVCGMYWRIFSEARENGLRMRQNGSSPLLQSALNLTHQQQQANAQQYSNTLCVHRNSVSSNSSLGGGLQMQIDQHQQRKTSPACNRRDSAAKVLLPTISDDGMSDDGEMDSNSGRLMPVPEQGSFGDRNQNSILLTLQSASGEIKRNYSARQLPLLGTSSQDLRESQRLQGVRQVHSSPNLIKYEQVRQDSLSDDSNSRHLLGHNQLQNTQTHRQHHHSHSHSLPHQHSHVLQIPAIHASPKACSFAALRHRLSNASSLFKYREESRAARISILVVIMFLVSYLPYGFLVLLQSRVSAANFKHSTQLAIFMILLGNLFSPFIFAYRNKRVRRGVKRLLGFDANTQERKLQRQNSSSCRGSGFLQRHSSSIKAVATTPIIKRNDSRVSTYSSNSCKYLTPQASVVSNVSVPASGNNYSNNNNTGNNNNNNTSNSNNNGTNNIIPVHTTLALRPNSSCSTIINFNINKTNNADSSAEKPAERLLQGVSYPPMRMQRPKLERGITIDEQKLPLSSRLAAKRSIFKFFFRTPKSCIMAQQQQQHQQLHNCTRGGCEANVMPAEV